MEPLDDKELNHLLQQWKAPATPAGIEQRVLPRSAPWWKWLFMGAIRVPVPVALAMVAVLALVFYFRTADKPKAEPQNCIAAGHRISGGFPTGKGTGAESHRERL